MYSSGRYVASPLNFDSSHWSDRTDIYISLIHQSITPGRWDQVADALTKVIKRALRCEDEEDSDTALPSVSASGFFVPDSDPPAAGYAD